ncbi:hypothetical protein L2E82_47309 [Cichorium intybus]|uniref:Uncharacterized protein n=1 Tax=Cichorium intybus TaxID=13427 RepID=A0ACB8YUD2_CICIN|nr:hypothetical protein L2E82_47309 [Cichorium intybus]
MLDPFDYPVTSCTRAANRHHTTTDSTFWKSFGSRRYSEQKRVDFGHHVRLATHENFRSFIETAGVDFYPLGGDPHILVDYMARNKGLIPLAPGEIIIQRKQLKDIIESILLACTKPDLKTGQAFRAQAIIANPPAYGQFILRLVSLTT